MQCMVCGKDSVGEVCNSCIRSEQVLYSKEWTYKEGLIVKKTEDFKLTISNARINGIAVISTSASGMNAKVDNFNHYIGFVMETGTSSFSGKPAPMVHVKTAMGMERYLIFPQFTDEAGMKAALDQAKAQKLSSGGAAPAAGGAAADPAAAEKLKKLDLLKANGILSEDEYQREKAKLGL